MRIAVFVLALLLSSCTNDPSYINYSRQPGFILADTTYTANRYLTSADDLGYPIYYLGAEHDTIHIGREYWYVRPRTRLKDSVPYIFRHFPANLSITVDTLHQLTRSSDYLRVDGTLNRDSSQYFHASAVILHNISDTAMYMGITWYVYYMHRELRNSKGEWIKIGEKLSGNLWCATGAPDITLEPGDIMISKVCHYGGTHPVACRLAFGRRDQPQVYSNVFTECIDDTLLHVIEML
jgi:hypothetical protein